MFVFDPFGLAGAASHTWSPLRGARDVGRRARGRLAAGRGGRGRPARRRRRRLLGDRRRAAARAAAVRRGARPAPAIDSVVRWAYGQGGRELHEALARATGEAADDAQLTRRPRRIRRRARVRGAGRPDALLDRGHRPGAAARVPVRPRCALGALVRDHRRPAARRGRHAVSDRRCQGLEAAATDLPGAALGDRRPRIRARDAGRRPARAAAAAVPRRGRATSRRCRTWPRSPRRLRATTSSWSRSSTTSPRPAPATAGRPRRSSTATARGCCCPGVADLETLRYFAGLIGEEEARDLTRTTGAGGTTRSTARRRRPLVAPEALRQLPDGHALLLYGRLAPARLRLRMWFEDRRLRRLADAR